MIFELPKLPFENNALEPIISARTIDFHYGKHHRAYVNNLNKLIAGTEFENFTLEEIIKKANGGTFNNGAQIWNHTFYWESITPDFTKPSDALIEQISKNFSSFEAFKEKFINAATTLFGSGWVWLVKKQDGKLDIIQESNAGNPLRNGLIPLLTCDVWEHAYYLDYQNRRPDYANSFFEIINWKAVEKRI
ncbi:MAG: superoxide dismutase [Bacteroidales bacterium]|nr:superoxide dismutase [Bacteroidales bacterium]